MSALTLEEAPQPRLAIHEGEDESSMWVCRFAPGEPGGWGEHVHRQHQIAWVSHGAATATIDGQRWAVSPAHAVWIPGGAVHDISNRHDAMLHCLYIWPEHCPVEWPDPAVLTISALARELLLCLGEPGMETAVSAAGTTMLFDQLEPLSALRPSLPIPTDDRAAALAQAIIARPADSDTLEQWADRLATSASTLRRAFVAETGLSYTDWRTHARLQASLAMLADGMSVGRVAFHVGYATPSGFVSAFRKRFGHTPGSFQRGFDRSTP